MSKFAGLFLFLGGCIILMGIITAEIFYTSTYSISLDMISTLGSSPPPHSVIRQPAASIFDMSMMIGGITIMRGAYILSLNKKHKKFALLLVFMGAGALGVGIFPAYHAIAHPIVALITFASGGVAALSSARLTSAPFRFVCLVLGSIAVFFLILGVLFAHLIVPVLGPGGAERWVAYPTIIWILGFGSYLMAKEKLT